MDLVRLTGADADERDEATREVADGLHLEPAVACSLAEGQPLRCGRR